MAGAIVPSIEMERMQEMSHFLRDAAEDDLRRCQSKDAEAYGWLQRHDSVPVLLGDEKRIAGFHARVYAMSFGELFPLSGHCIQA